MSDPDEHKKFRKQAPKQFRNSALNLFRLQALVTLINIGTIWWMYQQIIGLILWTRRAYIFTYTEPRIQNWVAFQTLYHHEFGRPLNPNYEAEHPQVHELMRLRALYEDTESSDSSESYFTPSGSEVEDNLGLD